MDKKLFLIDGYALIYRAFFAFGTRPLITKEGQNVSALYGFFNSLFTLIEKEKPEYMAVVLDSSEPTFRHRMYPEYKATREKMPDELKDQIPLLYEMIESAGIEMISEKGYEADDLIGALCQKAPDKGFMTYVYTSDKDLAQLVNEKVFIYDPKDQKIYDREGVKKKFELYPEQIKDYLTLLGDSSDNIPGVPRVGKKTAVKLLQQFGSVKGIYDNIEEVGGKAVKESLRNNTDTVELSSGLVKIETDIAVELNEEKLHIKSFNFEKLADHFYKYGMKRLLEYLEKKQGVKQGRTDGDRYDPEHYDFTVAESISELENICKDIKKAGKFSVSPVIEGEHIFSYRLKGLSVSCKEYRAFYIGQGMSVSDDIQPSLFADENNDPMTDVMDTLRPVFNDPSITLIGHDIKKFRHVLKNYGTDLKCKVCDLLIADFLLRSGTSAHSEDKIARYHLGHFMIDPSDARFKDHTAVSEKSEVLFRAYFKIRKDLKSSADIKELFDKMETPLSEVLFGMERTGIKTDKNRLEKISAGLKEKASELKKTIFEEAGEEFNPDSPKQLSEVLFENMNLKSGRKGKSGTYSTDHAVLKKLASQGIKIAELLLDYREVTKLNNTYAEGLIKYVYPPTGRIHTTFLQHIASTGRLSSSNPNLQSIPIKNEDGEKIRTAFIAPKGYRIVSADYSQIELRILAHFCRDENLTEAFKNGLDIHSATASSLFGVEIEDVTKEMRIKAKTANFAVLYGKSKYGLSEDMGISYQEASDFIDRYFESFKQIKEYIEDTRLFIEQYGFVKTLFGRKREISEIRSANKNIKSSALRAAVNAPIQGTSADIIKKAMINISKKINGHNAKMLLQIHDELIFEVKEDEVKEFSKLLTTEMENAVKLDVPLKINIGTGDDWLEAH